MNTRQLSSRITLTFFKLLRGLTRVPGLRRFAVKVLVFFALRRIHAMRAEQAAYEKFALNTEEKEIFRHVSAAATASKKKKRKRANKSRARNRRRN